MIRSPWYVIAAGSLLLPTAGRASWVYYGGSPQHTGVAAETLPAPLSVIWKHATGYAKGNTASPVVDGDTVYFVSKDYFINQPDREGGRVYAVRADTGELKWKSPSGDEPSSVLYYTTPVISNGTLYVGASDGGMYALDAQTGSQKWKFVTTAMVRGHPLVEDGTLYFGSNDGFFYAIDAQTAVARWKFHATGDIASAPTLAPDSNELIYFCSSDGHLYALNRVSGKLKWSARTTAASGDNSPVAFQNRLFLAAGAQVFSFRARTGAVDSLIAPTSAPEADITCTPVFADDPNGDAQRPVMYFGDRMGNFYCFQQTRSVWKPVWKQKLDGAITAMPVMTSGQVDRGVQVVPPLIFVGANKGFVYAINALDGAVQWRYHLEAPLDLRTKYKYFNINAPLVVSDQHLLVLSDDGTLNAFGPEGVDVAGPIITQPRPARGTMLNGLPPLSLSAYLWDEGTGVNPASVKVYLDGQPLEESKVRYDERRGLKPGVVYDPVQRKIEYNSYQAGTAQKSDALQNGRHTVRVDAADWKGNANSLEWSFIVDNTLPARPRPQPGAPGTPGAPGGYGQGNNGRPGVPGGYNNPYGNQGTRPRPQPRRRPVRGGPGQPNYGAPGYGGARS